MALSLMLRNTSKLHANLLSQSYVKCTPIIVSAKDFSSSYKNRSILQNGNNNANITVPLNLTRGIKVSPVRLSAHGDHSKIWNLERALAVALMGLVPVGIIAPNAVADNLFSLITVIHFHWGLEACNADYVRPILFGNVVPKISMALIYLISITTLGGLIYYNVNDIGIGRTVRKFWCIKE